MRARGLRKDLWELLRIFHEFLERLLFFFCFKGNSIWRVETQIWIKGEDDPCSTHTGFVSMIGKNMKVPCGYGCLGFLLIKKKITISFRKLRK